MKEFKKEDLIAGKHFVRQRNGIYRVVLDKVTSTQCGWLSLERYDQDLLFKSCPKNLDLDIMSVYIASEAYSLRQYLSGAGLTKIWERDNEQAIQTELATLAAKIDEAKEAFEDFCRKNYNV